MLFFFTVFQNPEKFIMVSAKMHNSNAFNIDDKKRFLSSTSDWSNGCWKFRFALPGMNYNLKYNIENSYFKL